MTRIEWTELSWNPVTGCTKVSEGCRYCYADAITTRFGGDFTQIILHHDRLTKPIHWKKPRRIFVNSMSDLFHEKISIDYIAQVFEVMRQAHWHQFQVLTKRAERLQQLAPSLPWADNIWMGVSVESRPYLHRIDHLRRTPAAIKFISFEPLLESLGVVDLHGIDWAIVGGESGPHHRPMEPSWVMNIVAQCQKATIPCFVKQDSRRLPGQQGRLPNDLWHVKEYPHT